MLKLDNVTISYKNVPTVQNFNLDMKEGQIVSLVGESGSGKTTVIRAVLGLLASPMTGSVKLWQQPMKQVIMVGLLLTDGWIWKAVRFL